MIAPRITSETCDNDGKKQSQQMIPDDKLGIAGDKICKCVHTMFSADYQVDDDGSLLTPAGDKPSAKTQKLFEMMVELYDCIEDT